MMNTALRIAGAGGGKGGGGSEQADSLRSTQTADVLDLLSEGEVEGLTNDLKSIYLDGVPLQNSDGAFNFKGVQVAYTYGTQGQASIAGSDGVQNEIAVAVSVLAATPIVRTITNPAIDSVRVTIAVPQLSAQDTSSGDLKGSTFTWAVDVQSNGGGYVEQFPDTVTGKTMSRYTRAKRFRLTGAAPWDIRVRRVTADSGSAAIVNAFQWASYTEIQSLQLRYPNSALARVRVDAQQFARIPVRGYDFMGLRIQVPTNYNPITRAYSGVWNGTFKIAWTDNPAWIFHDMVRHTRYGLGRYVPVTEAMKWELYSIGQYCDGMVPDGRGGIEPRFRCGLVLSTREQAYKVLTDLAAIFRGMSYWANTDVAVTQDAPSDPVALFTPANTVNRGNNVYFTYSGASNSKRHSSVVVWFNSLSEQGKLVPEVVVDRVLEARYGVRPLELSPLGVWSRGQAHRIGKWVLYSEQMENQTVSFRVGLDGVLVPPGRTFQVADPTEAGERLGGRVRSATTTVVTLDAPVTLASGESYTLKAMVQDPADPAKLRAEERAVTTPAGTTSVLTVATAFSSAPAVATIWVLQSDAIAATTWRCLSVAEVKGSNDFEIVGLAHQPAKYDLIEQGIAFEPRSVSRITLKPPAPTNLLFTETPYKLGSFYRSRMTVSWREPAPGLQYAFSWIFNGGQTIYLPRTSENSVDLDALPRGLLAVEVIAINALGNRSAALAGSVTVHGKTAPPSNVLLFTAVVVQGGVHFDWTANQEDDYLVTTLKIGSVILWEGAASSFLWAWPVPGTYTVTATHWDTSLNESATPASVTVTVDEAIYQQWGTLVGRPQTFRVVARGFSATSPPQLGLMNGETNANIDGAISQRSYMLAVIRRSDGVVTQVRQYDVLGSGTVGGRTGADLAADLNASTSASVVVVWTYDEPATNRLFSGIPEAMYRCGASRAGFGSSRFEYRSAYVLVGIPESGEGNGAESYHEYGTDGTKAACDRTFQILAGNLVANGTSYTPPQLDWANVVGVNVTTEQVQAQAITEAGVTLTSNTIGGSPSFGSTVASSFFVGPTITMAAGDRFEIEVSGRHSQQLFFGASIASIEVRIEIRNGVASPVEIGTRRRYMLPFNAAAGDTNLPIDTVVQYVPGAGVWSLMCWYTVTCLDSSGSGVSALKTFAAFAEWRVRRIKR